MAAKIVGGCMCGAVRYESAADAAMQASCYCRDCQRSTGGAFAPVLLVPKDAFKMTKGELKHYEVTGDSGNKVSRAFCANCGSPIMSVLSGMPFIAIKAGSLDDPTWSRGFLFSPALTVGGGTAEVQRNIVAEKVLGLPRDS